MSAFPTDSPVSTGPATPTLGKQTLFGLTIFLGAFLLFAVQPIFAKEILPWFGGSAAVWSTCLVFFQSVLLGGYLYAHGTTQRKTVHFSSWLHIGLLLASLLTLPIIPSLSERTQPSQSPVVRIFVTLAASLGIPYLLLSANSPLLQAWYLRRYPSTTPYRLFALSNAGSLAALLSYPVLVEPNLTTRQQAVIWSGLYAAFALICSFVAFQSRSAKAFATAAPEVVAGQSPTRNQRLTWLLLSGCSSALLLAITNHLAQNVAAVPFLWILPLSLYLLSFILCFERPAFYRRPLYVRLLAVGLGLIGYALYDINTIEALFVTVPVFAFALFVCCMFCHGELVARKPHPAYLTDFYLSIALGGALGAVAVGLLAPMLLSNTYEMPICLVLVSVLATIMFAREGWGPRLLWSAVTVAMVIVLAMNIRAYSKNSLMHSRNFYGALRVTQTPRPGPQQTRTLFHGIIQHGAQFTMLPFRRLATTYYNASSGVGMAIRQLPHPRRLGVIGLGTGTMAAYGEPGDYIRFYDINPQVIDIAQNLFTFTRETQAKVDFVLGDARLSLQREPPQQFDMLVIDAFSGDAIPVHLITRQAFDVYKRHLKSGGVMAFHISNQYLKLAPVVASIASDAGYSSTDIVNRDDDAKLVSSSDWVLVSRNQKFMNSAEIGDEGEEIEIPKGFRMWTDDYNNLFQILKTPRRRR